MKPGLVCQAFPSTIRHLSLCGAPRLSLCGAPRSALVFAVTPRSRRCYWAFGLQPFRCGLEEVSEAGSERCPGVPGAGCGLVVLEVPASGFLVLEVVFEIIVPTHDCFLSLNLGRSSGGFGFGACGFLASRSPFVRCWSHDAWVGGTATAPPHHRRITAASPPHHRRITAASPACQQPAQRLLGAAPGALILRNAVAHIGRVIARRRSAIPPSDPGLSAPPG